jgi:inorganic pyrophosphatase
LGMLKMTDEAGEDAKLLAVPTKKILPYYNHINSLDDVNPLLLKTIAHFFEHYKDLEEGKWVKVEGWAGIEEAHKEITDGLANYAQAQRD